MASHPTRVLLADDHKLLRRLMVELLKACPDMTVVGEAGDGEEAHRQTLALRPDLLLLDLYMPNGSGLDVLRQIRADAPETVVVILTSSPATEDALAAFHAGAQGYLLKTMEPETLCLRLREAMLGEMPIAAEVAKEILRRGHELEGGNEHLAERLSSREIEVVMLIADGLGNREISTRLLLSENTVKNHIRRILEKLHLQNRAQIAATWAGRSAALSHRA